MSGGAGIEADGWDAGMYDAISDMQLGWGIKVLDRIEPTGDETSSTPAAAPAGDRADRAAGAARPRDRR